MQGKFNRRFTCWYRGPPPTAERESAVAHLACAAKTWHLKRRKLGTHWQFPGYVGARHWSPACSSVKTAAVQLTALLQCWQRASSTSWIRCQRRPQLVVHRAPMQVRRASSAVPPCPGPAAAVHLHSPPLRAKCNVTPLHRFMPPATPTAGHPPLLSLGRSMRPPSLDTTTSTPLKF